VAPEKESIMVIFYQTSESEGGVTRLTCHGEFHSNSRIDRLRLHTLCSAANVELDLRQVEPIDPAGVQFLLLLLHHARVERRRLVILGIGPHLFELFGLLGQRLGRPARARAVPVMKNRP